MEAKPLVCSLYGAEKKNLPKEVILYAFSVLIWRERRKSKKIFLFWLAKCLLQESVVCKEEKYFIFSLEKGTFHSLYDVKGKFLLSLFFDK
ncbi:hypothetical protein KLL36_03315 [Clostridioides difficile]|uniref:hypothetical protein n=1 Tax=Clostridioides difficile TaxID=1496 RepID=UPI00131CCE58|nr:hypothetical protein [Clostridioides difficile]MDL5065337.1 hypothetical protein [Clostridioides difficile]MDN9452479.1 hypothetical protein [Clostridioides difficile]HBF7897574.1 hypothetical protein [Clostridioides difficile]